MQRLIVFPVPSAALGKTNQNSERLNAKLDIFDDYSCSICYKIYSSFPQRKSSCNEISVVFSCFVPSSQLICSLLQVNQSLFSAGKSSFDRFLISKAMKSNYLSRHVYRPHSLIPLFVILCHHCAKKVLLLLQCNTALHKMLRGSSKVS